MYSGTTIRAKSGRIVGVHQRIDRLARRNLRMHASAHVYFPTVRDILQFEGLNGPDGIKRKSPGVDEPWHHIDPYNDTDRQLWGLIDNHIHNLAAALKKQDEVRAAYEAAWLAHAITDGLTPAHHDGLGDKIEELWGKAHHERDSVRDKALIRGVTRVDTLRKNWEYWGGGGVFTAHLMFEWGVAVTIAPMKLSDTIGANPNDFIRLEAEGFEQIFYESLRKVADMHMYEEFGRKGWTRHLAKETKQVLIPEIVKAVTLAWYAAMVKAYGKKHAR